MLKAIRIIFINLILVVVICICIDWFLLANELYHPCFRQINFRENNDDISFDKSKKSVITAGCSFVYGMNSNLEDTFAYKLQKYTKRKVYNIGIPGYGPQQILWQINNASFFNGEEIIEPEYYIYTYIPDHIRRMYSHYYSIPIRENNIMNLYKVKGNKFIPRKENEILFTDYFYITQFAKILNLTKFKYLKNDNEKFDLFKLYMKEIKKELNKRYGNIKFVIIVYNLESDISQYNLPPFITERWKELEDDGFIIIHLDTPEYDYLNTEEYLTWDRTNLLGSAWDKIVPIVSEKLNLL